MTPTPLPLFPDMTELYHIVLKEGEEIERDRELQNAYKRGYEDGCAIHTTIQSERDKVLDDVISLINKNCFELEGKRLKITPLLLLQEIEKLRTPTEAHR